MLFYLQLAIRKEQTCRSRGYSLRFMGHDNVNDILQGITKDSAGESIVVESCVPYAVQNRSVGKYTYINIWHNNVVKMSLFLVGKEQIGHPDSVGIRQREILQSSSEIVELEPFVQPLLAERQLYAVLLQNPFFEASTATGARQSCTSCKLDTQTDKQTDNRRQYEFMRLTSRHYVGGAAARIYTACWRLCWCPHCNIFATSPLGLVCKWTQPKSFIGIINTYTYKFFQVLTLYVRALFYWSWPDAQNFAKCQFTLEIHTLHYPELLVLLSETKKFYSFFSCRGFIANLTY